MSLHSSELMYLQEYLELIVVRIVSVYAVITKLRFYCVPRLLSNKGLIERDVIIQMFIH